MIDRLFTTEGIGQLLGLPFVQSALIACAVLGLVAGMLAPLIVSRGMAFAVHGTAELAFTGGAAALLTGVSVGLGAVAGAVVAGVVFGLLTGSIVSVDSTNLVLLTVVAVLVLGVLATCYRPLLFASTDPDVALARGVPVRLLSLVFAVLIALTTALAVPIVGAIMVLSVMIAPGAAAARVTANPVVATVLAVLFAELALLGGTVLSLAPGLPVSGYVAAIAFACYLGCRLVARLRRL